MMIEEELLSRGVAQALDSTPRDTVREEFLVPEALSSGPQLLFSGRPVYEGAAIESPRSGLVSDLGTQGKSSLSLVLGGESPSPCSLILPVEWCRVLVPLWSVTRELRGDIGGLGLVFTHRND